ncbi:MAG: hypothetical protein ACTSUV_01075 [Candidatus Ranarchaeia archaeon]
MILVQQTKLNKSKLLDKVTFQSKNLYNTVTYIVRQRFFKDRHWTRFYEL